MKVTKLLFEKNAMPFDCAHLVDEMYLQKSVLYHSSNFLGQNEVGNLYKGIVFFKEKSGTRRALTTPSILLRDFIFQSFSIINFISPAIKTITKDVCVWSVSEKVLINFGKSTNFTCDLNKK